MKKLLPAILLFSFAYSAVNAQGGLCDTMYWNHTYANARLKIYDSCRTITGTVKIELPPPFTGDGDYHIYIQPDTQYLWMNTFRDTNYTKLCEGSDSNGYEICATCLNVEEVCKGAPTALGGVQGTVDSACANFNDTVYLPATGEYVSATGPFIYDTVHCWNELHPISRMFIVNPTNVPELYNGAFLEGMKLFPQPADKEVEFEFNSPPHAITLIRIYNSGGRLLFVYGIAETNLLYLDVSEWPSGEYPYSIVAQEGSKLLKSGVISVVRR